MKKLFSLLAVVGLALTTAFAAPEARKYESVAGDPLKTRIYTLDNGLKVYMSVNPEKPRVQTYIAVRVGGKNDPAETTGLAHYFEHLMFKGTKQFGTQNYETEKALLDQIEASFEKYRTITDSAERVAMYKVIDSLSYQASKLSIPNEYDKLMAAIGASGTNAWTSYDETNYTEDIPANEIENWAKIQSDRFANNVIRGFHTELETVYEEKNMSLTSDGRKMYEALLEAMFTNHPYGKQTVLGTQEHLKNPSITNIKNYYKKWYVPNNMAICMAGDFNPDTAIEIIDKYFGGLQPNKDLALPKFEAEVEMTAPVETSVMGLEAENLYIAYRTGGSRTDEPLMLSLIDGLMNNGKAGIIDLNITQKQAMLQAWSSPQVMSDYSMYILAGTPKEGQTLEEARDLLIAQIEKLKKGEFDEALLRAVIDNYRLSQMYEIESNQGRTYNMMRSFIDMTPWADKVTMLDRMAKITKADVVKFANDKFKNNYAVVYKRQGKDPNEKKIEKPHITPIETNREAKSDFLVMIQNSQAPAIEPRFVDFDKDMQKLKSKAGLEVLYKQNETNGTFSLNYVFEMGRNSDKKLSIATRYLNFLGTSKYTPEQIKTMFYNMACSFYVNAGAEQLSIGVYGLAENQSKAIALLEEVIADAKVDEGSLELLKSNLLKQRTDAKLDQGNCFSALRSYTVYGPKSPMTNIPTNDELKALKGEELVSIIKGLPQYDHRVIYYGPKDTKALLADIDKLHKTPAKRKAVPSSDQFEAQITKESKVYLAPYDAAQIYYVQVNNEGDKFDLARMPYTEMYNEYFGGGMSGIVFQEMREARGLAYSAGAWVSHPYDLKKTYSTTAFIATQNDKMVQAIEAFDEIINNMPTSEAAFKIAKESLLTRLRTDRTTKSDVLYSYISMQKLGLNEDMSKLLFDAVQKLTLDDVIKYQKQYVKDKKWTYAILGREAELDVAALEKLGPVERLTLEQIFGY